MNRAAAAGRSPNRIIAQGITLGGICITILRSERAKGGS